MRRSGLGPQGHAAIQRAAETQSEITRHAPVIGEGNPAVIAAPDFEAEETVPPMRPFDSSRVDSAGYDSEHQRLYVRFVKPDRSVGYVYEGVPSNVWRNLIRSASPGRFVNRVLNGYDYHKGDF
jgi:KTSC domain